MSGNKLPKASPGEGAGSHEFLESSIDWAIHHLGEAKTRLKAGENAEFHCAMRKFGACAKAILDTVPEVEAQQPHA